MTQRLQKRTSDFQLVEYLCFRLLPVQILLAAVSAVNGTLSSLFATNCVGTQAMSAVGLYGPIRTLLSAVGTMLLGGSQILCGKYMGKNQLKETEQVFSLDIAVSVIFGGTVTVLMLALAACDLTGVFAKDAALRPYFNQYLLGMAIGVLPQILSQQLSGFLSLENRAGRNTAASIACMIANVLLNYLFVVVLSWQAFGLALASSLSLWVFFGVQSLYYLRGKSAFRVRIKGLHWGTCGQVVRTGIPSALCSGYMTVRGFIVNGLIVSFVGSIGLSAFAACNALLDFFWAVPAGMLAVSRMLISISTGEEDRKTLQDIMRVVLRRYVPLMAGIALLLCLFAVPLTRLYYQNSADPVFGMTVWGFRILPLCMPLSLICMHFVCYGQASDKHGLVHVLSVIDGVLAVALFSAILVPKIGIVGAYAANVLNGVMTTAVIVLYAWIRNRRFPRNLEELMVIPADFGVPEEDRMDLTVRSMEEVVRISRDVQAFCTQKGIDGRRAYYAALAVEEMAGNVVEHGFTKDRKQHSVDLRIVCKGDSLILRIKDDCVPFDPAERAAMFDPGDPAKNIGIRMVYTLARDVRYRNSLGLNALTVWM